MVLLILALVWIVILAPGYMKKRAERRSTGSIESFHHQLHLLERTGPKLVEPAYRLETARARQGPAPGASGYPVVSSAPGRANLVLLKPVDENQGAAVADVVDDRQGTHYQRVAVLEPEVETDPEPPRRPGPDPYRRQLARRRRRDTLAVLAGTFFLTAVLGSVRALRPLWVVTLLSGLALMAYIALIVYAQSLEADRRQSYQGVAFGYGSAPSPGGSYDPDEFDHPYAEVPRQAAGGR